jgi:hypothetical protein
LKLNRELDLGGFRCLKNRRRSSPGTNLRFPFLLRPKKDLFSRRFFQSGKKLFSILRFSMSQIFLRR